MLYEARSYRLHPGKLPEYLALLTGEEGVLDILRPHLCGFWYAESGTLNTVHHLWAYESRAARAAVRAANAGNAVMPPFVGKVTPLLQFQTSRLMAGTVGKGDSDRSGGVYDRVTLAFRSGARAGGCERLFETLRGVLLSHFEGVAWLRGAAFELAGPPRDGLFVLRSASLDERDRNWAEVAATLHEFDAEGVLASVDSELMLPAAFSPWR